MGRRQNKGNRRERGHGLGVLRGADSRAFEHSSNIDHQRYSRQLMPFARKPDFAALFTCVIKLHFVLLITIRIVYSHNLNSIINFTSFNDESDSICSFKLKMYHCWFSYYQAPLLTPDIRLPTILLITNSILKNMFFTKSFHLCSNHIFLNSCLYDNFTFFIVLLKTLHGIKYRFIMQILVYLNNKRFRKPIRKMSIER